MFHLYILCSNKIIKCKKGSKVCKRCCYKKYEQVPRLQFNNYYRKGLRGLSHTTFTRFGFFWPPTPLRLHFLWYKSLQKVHFFDHLPPFSCKRSLWTSPKQKWCVTFWLVNWRFLINENVNHQQYHSASISVELILFIHV